MKELNISVIILTYNEGIHIRRCIENVQDLVQKIFIIDSFSTDETVRIAEGYEKVTVLQNKWENNYAKQFNWALEHAPIRTKWVLRLDADEYLTEELKKELINKLPFMADDVTAISLPLRRVFLGRTIKYGTGKIFLLRIFRKGAGACETRWMDEHIQINGGRIEQFDNEFADDNLNDLSWWTRKHIGYAIREAADLLDVELDLYDHCKEETADKILLPQALNKRKKKYCYARLPLFGRSFIYFCYRYFLKGGFLEGKEGFLWHFLQGWWYRTLVDAKIFEIKRICGKDKDKVKAYLDRYL